MKNKLLLLIALLCCTIAWAQTEVTTDEELRAAIAVNGANIIVTEDINLSNSTLKGGWGGNGGDVTISGGYVYAEGGKWAAGIGSGCEHDS